MEAKTTELNGLEAKKKELLDKITAQPVSAHEVQEMSIRRDKLMEQKRSLQLQLEKANEGIVEGERACSKSTEEITGTTYAFNTRASELKLVPGKQQGAAAGVSFEMSVSASGERPQDIMNVDMKNTILPALGELKAEYNQTVHALKEEVLSLKAQANQADDEVAEKSSHLKAMEEGIRSIESEVAQAQNGEDAELEELMSEKKTILNNIGTSRSVHADRVSQLQHTIEAVKQEYEEQKTFFMEEQKVYKQQLMKAMEMITGHKTYIHNSVMEVKMNTGQVQAALQKAC